MNKFLKFLAMFFFFSRTNYYSQISSQQAHRPNLLSLTIITHLGVRQFLLHPQGKGEGFVGGGVCHCAI